MKDIIPKDSYLRSPFNACQHRYDCRAMYREIKRLNLRCENLHRDYQKICADRDTEIEQLQKLYDVAVADRVRMHDEIDTDRVQHLLNIKRKDAEIERLQREVDIQKSLWAEAEGENQRLREAES